MALETIVRYRLETGSFELEWENSGDFLHLLCHHPNLSQPLGLSLDSRERQNFLQIVREAQKLQGQPLEQAVRLGSLPGRPARLRLAMAPGPLLLVEAVGAGRQLFEVQLDSRSTLRAFIHMLSEPQDRACREIEAPFEEASATGVRLGTSWGTWNPHFSHVVGPDGEWLPLEELKPPLRLRGWLNDAGVWERLSLERYATLAEGQRLASEGLYWQAEAEFHSTPQDGPTALGQAYLAVQRGPLPEALPFLEKARALSAELSEAEENLLLELETYLLCQDGPDSINRVAQNMQKLVARQITRNPWGARRALSNWRVFLDLLYGGQVPSPAIHVWQGWQAQLPTPVHTPTLNFARPAAVAPAPASGGNQAPARVLPPERSLAAPLAAIALALILGMWWRWKHPVQWDAATPTPSSQRP